MAGLAYFLGLTSLGATAIRGGSGSVAFLAELVLRHRPTAMVGVPTLLAAVGEAPRGATASTRRRSASRRIVCIGEPVRRDDLSLSAARASGSPTLWGAQVLGDLRQHRDGHRRSPTAPPARAGTSTPT